MSTAEAKYETAQERMNAILEGFRGDMRTAIESLRGDFTTAQEKLRGDMNTALEGLRKDQEKLRGDMESRHSSSLRWTFMLVLGAVTLIISAVAGFNLYGAGGG